MVQKEKIYTALKYIGAFLLCTICFCCVILLIAELDKDRLEMTKCFLFEAGRITKDFDYQSYLQGYCKYPQICACSETSDWVFIFYYFSLPIFVFYEVLRRKIIPYQHSYLCVLGEIFIWALLWYFDQDNIPYKWFAINNTYKFIAPMAIMMLALHSLPAKVLKGVAIVIGAIYGLLLSFFIVNAFINIFNNLMI